MKETKTPTLPSVFEEVRAEGVDDSLGIVARLCNELLKLQQQLEQAEASVSELKEKIKAISEGHIPDKFNELGVERIDLQNAQITVKPFYSGSIINSQAFGWLDESGHGGIIKTDIVVPFARDRQRVHAALDAIRKINKDAMLNESVHPQTLKAFIREQMESGNELPKSLFSVFVGKRTSIKSR